MSVRAVGLDLGETLVYYAGLPLNWQARYPEALARMAQAYGHTLTAAEAEAGAAVLRRYNTRLRPRLEEETASHILGQALAAWGLPAADMGLAEDAFFGFFRQTYTVYPDTLPALQTLRAHGLKVGVLTDVPYGMPRRFIAHDLAPVAPWVDASLTSVEVGRRKPHPDGYFALATRLGVSPSEMLYVGNEEKDIAGANAAGLASVLIDRTRSGADFGQARTITSLAELSADF